MKSRRQLPVLSIANPLPAMPTPAFDSPLATDAAGPGLSTAQVFVILRAYWLQTLLIVIALTVIVAGVIKLMPKTFTATTTLMVNPDGIDPLASVQQNSTPLFNYMSTESQLMLSAEVMLPVIEKLDLAHDKSYSAGYRGDGSTLPDWIRENLVKALDIQVGSFGSQLININASAQSPQLAALIANTLAEVYLAQQRKRVSGPASARAERYSLELAELKDKVRVAQDQVTAFRQRSGITDITEKTSNTEQALLGMLEEKLQDAENARRAAEVRAAAQQSATSAANSPSVQNIRSLLSAQQGQLAQLRTTYGAEHPKVRELDSQIRATQRSLEAELNSVTSNNSSELVAAQQLVAKMRAAVDEQRIKVLGVNKLSDEATKYELELESAQSVYKRALDGYDQIMFASGSHNANISIVSKAVPPQKAAKPNKAKLFLVGVVIALGVGFAAPLLYELLLNRRIRCRDDFERDFSLPVLMEFDRIRASAA